jgi:transposase
MPHHRASYTPLGRSVAVRRVVGRGETFAQAAACAGVSKSTVWAWVQRWNAATEGERDSLVCLADRSSRPRSSPSQVPAVEAARICALREKTGWSPRRLADEPGVSRPHSTVHMVLRRAGCSRLPAPERPAVIRNEWPRPGNLVHMDVKKSGKFTEPGHKMTGDRTRRSRRVGWEYWLPVASGSPGSALGLIVTPPTSVSTRTRSRSSSWIRQSAPCAGLR